jgi:hypothetical protein
MIGTVLIMNQSNREVIVKQDRLFDLCLVQGLPN